MDSQYKIVVYYSPLTGNFVGEVWDHFPDDASKPLFSTADTEGTMVSSSLLGGKRCILETEATDKALAWVAAREKSNVQSTTSASNGTTVNADCVPTNS